MTSIIVFILAFAGAVVIGWSVRRVLIALLNIELPLAEVMILASGAVGYLGFWALYADRTLGLVLHGGFLALPVLLIAWSAFRIVRSAPLRSKLGWSSAGTELRSVTGAFLLGLGFLALLGSFGNTSLPIEPNLLLSNDVRPGDNVLPQEFG